MNAVTQSLAGLPAFLLYFAVGLALLAAFVFVYVRVTPYDEIALIREGNTAAAISLAGALVGFVLPLASAIAHSVGLVDMVVWAIIAFVAQLAAYFVVGRVVPQFAAGIRAGRTASATLLAAVATAVGILNAASLSY